MSINGADESTASLEVWFVALSCFLVVFLHADGPRMPHPAVAALKGD